MKSTKRKRNFKLKLKLKIQKKDDVDTADSLSPRESPKYSGKFNENHIYQIEQNLFMCGYPSTRNLEALKAQGITRIVNLTSHYCKNLHETTIKYSNFELADNPKFNLLDKLDLILKELARCLNNGERVLVHCKMGVSRAPSIVIAFLIKHRGFAYKEAFKYVQNRNGKIAPNLGYLMQLQTL